MSGPKEPVCPYLHMRRIAYGKPLFWCSYGTRKRRCPGRPSPKCPLITASELLALLKED